MATAFSESPFDQDTFFEPLQSRIKREGALLDGYRKLFVIGKFNEFPQHPTPTMFAAATFVLINLKEDIAILKMNALDADGKTHKVNFATADLSNDSGSIIIRDASDREITNFLRLRSRYGADVAMFIRYCDSYKLGYN